MRPSSQTVQVKLPRNIFFKNGAICIHCFVFELEKSLKGKVMAKCKCLPRPAPCSPVRCIPRQNNEQIDKSQMPSKVTRKKRLDIRLEGYRLIT